jgi:hypothetical protein
VRTDSTPETARAAVDAAERAHAALVQAYGTDLAGEPFTLFVFTDRTAFEHELSEAVRSKGLTGECRAGYALVFWPNKRSGEDTLAHELVHRFNATLLPKIPFWIDEGLAEALAPKREYGDWLTYAALLDADQLRARVRSLDALPEGDDYATRCLVGAAVVRFGLQTGGFADVRSIRSWKPDTEAFLAWMRGPRSEKNFPSIWKTPGLTSPSSIRGNAGGR